MRVRLAIAGLGVMALAGCATPGAGPVEATRFHLGDPVARGSITVEPLLAGTNQSLEYQTYAAAVSAELQRAGYTIAPNPAADFVATVSFSRVNGEGPPRSSPISIGLGGSSYSGGWHGGGGVGGGISFPLGGSRPRDLVLSQLAVQIKKRSDGGAIWEGRAQFGADARAPDASPDAAAARLAHALFVGFPGDSGRTITVK